MLFTGIPRDSTVNVSRCENQAKSHDNGRTQNAGECLPRFQKNEALISHAGSGLDTSTISLHDMGKPLSRNDRAFFEPRFGYDLSQVRIHDE
jgi:hypothetical protein